MFFLEISLLYFLKFVRLFYLLISFTLLSVNLWIVFVGLFLCYLLAKLQGEGENRGDDIPTMSACASCTTKVEDMRQVLYSRGLEDPHYQLSDVSRNGKDIFLPLRFSPPPSPMVCESSPFVWRGIRSTILESGERNHALTTLFHLFHSSTVSLTISI